MSALDFSGREQLYYQLYDIMFKEIMDGKYSVGSLLPAESELMNKYEISRATVRKAMDMLHNDGLIEKRRGHGTYVIETKLKNSLNRVISYSKKNTENRRVASKQTISMKELPASKELAECLQLHEGDILVELKRVRYADSEPMYFETNIIEKSWVPEVMDRDFSKESLRVFLANRYKVSWSHAKQHIYSIAATQELAKLLQIKKGDPLIYIKRISYDSNDVPREYVETYYRADNYHLEIELAI